jgi:hypothetical protein
MMICQECMSQFSSRGTNSRVCVSCTHIKPVYNAVMKDPNCLNRISNEAKRVYKRGGGGPTTMTVRSNLKLRNQCHNILCRNQDCVDCTGIGSQKCNECQHVCCILSLLRKDPKCFDKLTLQLKKNPGMDNRVFTTNYLKNRMCVNGVCEGSHVVQTDPYNCVRNNNCPPGTIRKFF